MFDSGKLKKTGAAVLALMLAFGAVGAAAPGSALVSDTAITASADSTTVVNVSTYTELRNACNNTTKIVLLKDIVTEQILKISGNSVITIDLNGHTIDRGLANTSAVEAGSVIENNGTLTIQDSAGGGKITGGNTTEGGGGILNSGKLVIEGGSITGNKAAGGAGIFTVANGNDSVSGANTSSVTIKGGKITGNSISTSGFDDASCNGAGILLYDSKLYFEGDAYIYGNTKNGSENNVFVLSGSMSVSGALTSGAKIGIHDADGGNTSVLGWTSSMGDANNYLFSDSGSKVYDYKNNILKLVDASTHRVSGLSLSVVSGDSEIAVNWYVQLTEEEAANATVDFKNTSNGSVLIAEKVTQSGKGKISGQDCYKFSCPINAKNFSDFITPRLYINGTLDTRFGTDVQFSALDYAKVVMDSTDSTYANYKSLVGAMVSYGYEAQNYFAYNTGNSSLYTRYLTYRNRGSDPVDLTAPATISSTSISGLSYAGNSLLLQSKITQRFWFKLDSGASISNYSVSINGTAKTLTASASNAGYYYVDNTELLPQKFSTANTIIVSKGSEKITITSKPNDYIYSISKASNADDKLKALTNALYWYGKEAQAIL